MITQAKWTESKKSFTEMCPPGTEVDAEIFNWFLGCVPPRLMRHGTFLNGDPFSSNTAGETVYMAFTQFGSQYKYAGLMSVKELQAI